MGFMLRMLLSRSTHSAWSGVCIPALLMCVSLLSTVIPCKLRASEGARYITCMEKTGVHDTGTQREEGKVGTDGMQREAQLASG